MKIYSGWIITNNIISVKMRKNNQNNLKAKGILIKAKLL